MPFIAITEAVFTRLSDARVAEAVRRLAGDLVEAVLGGDAGPRELRRRARAFGMRGTLPMSFVALRPATAEAAQLARLAEAAGRFGPASIRDGVVAVLIEARDDGEAEGVAADLLRETGAGAAGVGRVRTEPAELARTYDEALYAVEARPVNGTPAVATFRDLGSIQLLLSLGDERGVELYCESMLGPLRAHDGRHGSALIESLQAYIEANGRWAEAAAALGVHRHTLRYRIRKIERLTGRRPRRRARPPGAVAGAAGARAAGPPRAGAGAVSRVAVVGAGGIIGPAIVATLAREDAVDEIVCLDMNGARAEEVAARHGGGKATAAALDIRDDAAAGRALAGATVLVNTASYRINLAGDGGGAGRRRALRRPGRPLPRHPRAGEAGRRASARPACWRCSAWARPRARRT